MLFNYLSRTISYLPKFITALCLYLALSIPAHFPKEALLQNASGADDVTSTFSQFRQLKETPEVILVGSSLMRSPIYCTDFKHIPSTPPFKHYHYAKWLEKQLSLNDLKPWHCFNLAVDGSMTSDVFLVCNKLLYGKQTPKLIIYGISPQAFSGAYYYSETNTPSFQLLFEPYDCLTLSNFYTSTWQERLNLYFNQLISLYRERSIYLSKMVALQTNMLAKSDNEISPIAKKIELEHKLKMSGLQILVSDENSANQNQSQNSKLTKYPGQVTALANCHVKCRLDWNPQLNQERFDKQGACLNALSKLVTERDITLLLVNMPLTKENLDKIPQSVKDDYRKYLANYAVRKNTFFLDLGEDHHTFDRSCFMDSMHLNDNGGDKFIPILASWFANVYLTPNQHSNANKLASVSAHNPQ